MLQELNINALWWAAQAAKGQPCTLAELIHRARFPGGGWLATNREDGSQRVSDLGKFGTASDWVQSLGGAGAPPVEATPEELAALWWAFEGAEVVAPVVGPPAKSRHTLTPIPGVGKWLSFLGRVGQSLITREQFADGLISQLVVEGSTANKAVRATPSLVFLDPSIKKGADPAAPLPQKRAFLHSDGKGTFEMDELVFPGMSAFTLTLNLDLQPVYGDSARIHDFAIGNAGVTIGATVYADADGVAQVNRQLFGEAAPPADARPLERIPALGSYAFDLAALDPETGDPNGDAFGFACPGVKWNVPERPIPNPEGGVAELAFTGQMRAVEGEEEYTATIDCDAPAFVR